MESAIRRSAGTTPKQATARPAPDLWFDLDLLDQALCLFDTAAWTPAPGCARALTDELVQDI